MIEKTPNTVIYGNKPKSNDIHPTMKPLDVLGKLINNSSKQGDIVLDLFSGSGGTIMACDQMGRICYATELDPVYADASVRRYRETCGGIIKLIRDGKEIPYDLR